MLTFQKTTDIILVMKVTKFISLELDMERIGYRTLYPGYNI